MCWGVSSPLAKAAIVRLLLRSKRGLFFVIEQPAQSWAFKLPWMIGVKALGSMWLDEGSVGARAGLGGTKFSYPDSILLNKLDLYWFVWFWFVDICCMWFVNFNLSFDSSRIAVLTWLGLLGHDLPKPTHLLTNLPRLGFHLPSMIHESHWNFMNIHDLWKVAYYIIYYHILHYN